MAKKKKKGVRSICINMGRSQMIVFSEEKNKAPNDTCSVTLAYVTKNGKTVTYFL